jgi:hypothetical protein
VKRKPADPWQEYPTRTVAGLAGFRPGPPVKLCRYGGLAGRKLPATGFFYPRKENGRWWLVDPDGHPYINLGVCSTTPGRSANNRAALKEKFGTEQKWAEAAMRLLREHGFHATGGWSAVDVLRSLPEPPVHSVSWNFLGTFGRERKLVHQQPGHLGYPNDVIPVFHPEFEPFCDRYAQALAANRNDPRLLGHFSDNELPSPADLILKSLALDPDDPHLGHGCRAAREWLARRKSASANASDLTEEDRDAFRGHVFSRYFEVTTRAIRKYDPNHMCLGPRLHGSSLRSPGILRAAGRHCDVIAMNVYWQWAPAPELLSLWEKEGGRPFLVTEYYAKGMDSGFPNNSGAGWIVPTQRDRALFYQHFCLALLESKQCVGWDWFKYMDNDPEDLTTDPSNRDSNKGIVTIRYEPYKDLLEGMRELNTQVYALVDFFDRRG